MTLDINKRLEEIRKERAELRLSSDSSSPETNEWQEQAEWNTSDFVDDEKDGFIDNYNKIGLGYAISEQALKGYEKLGLDKPMGEFAESSKKYFERANQRWNNPNYETSNKYGNNLGSAYNKIAEQTLDTGALVTRTLAVGPESIISMGLKPFQEEEVEGFYKEPSDVMKALKTVDTTFTQVSDIWTHGAEYALNVDINKEQEEYVSGAIKEGVYGGVTGGLAVGAGKVVPKITSQIGKGLDKGIDKVAKLRGKDVIADLDEEIMQNTKAVREELEASKKGSDSEQNAKRINFFDDLAKREVAPTFDEIETAGKKWGFNIDMNTARVRKFNEIKTVDDWTADKVMKTFGSKKVLDKVKRVKDIVESSKGLTKTQIIDRVAEDLKLPNKNNAKELISQSNNIESDLDRLNNVLLTRSKAGEDLSYSVKSELYDTTENTFKGENLARLEKSGVLTKPDNEGIFYLTKKGEKLINKSRQINNQVKANLIDNGFAHYPIDKYKTVLNQVSKRENGVLITKMDMDKILSDIRGGESVQEINRLAIDSELSGIDNTANIIKEAKIINRTRKANLDTLIKNAEETGDATKLVREINEKSKNEWVGNIKLSDVDRMLPGTDIKQIVGKLYTGKKITKQEYNNIKSSQSKKIITETQVRKSKIDILNAKISKTKNNLEKLRLKNEVHNLKTEIAIIKRDAKVDKLKLEAERGIISNFRKELLQQTKELSNSKVYKGDINGVIKRNFTKAIWDDMGPKDMIKTMETLIKDIERSHIVGLKKAIRNEFKGVRAPSKADVKANRFKYDIGTYKELIRAKKLYSEYDLTYAKSSDLENLLNDIQFIKKEGRARGNSIIEAQNIRTQRDIDLIKKEGGLKSLSEDKDIVKNSFKDRAKRFLDNYHTQLSFMQRIIERIGGGRDTHFYKTMITDVDVAFNNFTHKESLLITPILKKIDKTFNGELENWEFGSYMFAKRHILDADGNPSFEGLMRQKWDKTSALNRKRTDGKLGSVEPPKNWHFGKEEWTKVKDKYLGEIFEKYSTKPQILKLEEQILEVNDLVFQDVNELAKRLYNLEIPQARGYIPFSQIKGGEDELVSELGGKEYFKAIIGDGHMRTTSKHLKEGAVQYDYNISSLMGGKIRKQIYSSSMSEPLDRINNILRGKKVNIDKLKLDDKEIATIVNNQDKYKFYNKDGVEVSEVTDNIIRDEIMEIREASKMTDDLDRLTREQLKIYTERIAKGGDNFKGLDRFFFGLSSWSTVEALSFSPGAVLKQPLAFIDGAGILGARNLKWSGMATLTDGKLRQKIAEASGAVRARVAEVGIADYNKVDLGTGVLGDAFKGYKRFQDAGMVPLKILDQHSAMSVWLASYRKYMVKNGYVKKGTPVTEFNNELAIAYADDSMQRIMSTSNPLLTPPIYRSVYGRMFLQLFSTQLNRLNLLTNEAPALWRGGAKGEAVKLASAWALSSYAETLITITVAKAMYEIGFNNWDGNNAPFIELIKEGHKPENIAKMIVGQSVPGKTILSLTEWESIGRFDSHMVGIARQGAEFLNDPNIQNALKASGEFSNIPNYFRNLLERAGLISNQ